MELAIIALVAVAVIVTCVVYVALRDRRTSRERSRHEPGAQGAPYPEEAGISEQGYRVGGSGL